MSLVFKARIAALAFAVLFAAAQPAQAQLKPLDVENDFNGVDLLSGKIQTRPPELVAPGAGNLRFRRAQDLQPVMNGTLTANSPDGAATYDLNNGTLSSEHFDCDDNAGCQSKKKDGSTFYAAPTSKYFLYTQAGTGMQIQFDLQNFSQGPLVGGVGFAFASSMISYPNGEKLTISYDTFTGTNGYKYRRPTMFTSNLGYRLTLTYQAPWQQSGWTEIAQATMFGPGDIIVGQLTYSGDTITDLAGRVYTCVGCPNSLGGQATATTTTLRLPGESVDTLSASSANCGSTGYRYITNVTSDGVAYLYNFTSIASSCQYLKKAVITGPQSFSRTVNILADFNIRPRITSVVDSLARTISYQYDSAVRVTKITYPEGNNANVLYDLSGNITESRLKAKLSSGLADIVETAAYDAPYGCEGVLCYRPLWTRDAKAQQTDYSWSSEGDLLTRLEPTDASGKRRKTINEYAFSPASVSRLLRERICAANAAGVELTCGTAEEVVREFTFWGSTLLPLTETRKDGIGGQARTTVFAYDPAGRLLSSDGPLAGTDDAVYSRYDVIGRKTWEIGPKGANGVRLATRTTYRNADDQPLTVERGTVVNATDPALTVLGTDTSTYDTRRLLTSKRVAAAGADFAVTQLSHDARNRSSCTTVRMNPAAWASLPADACALGTAGTAGADRIARTSYDAEGRVTLIEKALGTPRQQNYVTYTYSANGKRLSVKDANDNLASMTYDGFDRQTKWSFPSKTTPGTVSTTDYEQYGYDANGNRTSLRKRDGRNLTFAYDATNRMTSKLIPDGCAPIQVGPCTPASATRDVFYAYDIHGRQLSAKYDSAAGADGLTSAYDVFGNLTSSTISMAGFAKTLTAQYDIANRRTRLTHPDGAFFDYSYDPADRMGLMTENGATSLASFAYDPTGNRSAMTRGGSSSAYGYDGAERLTSLGHDLASTNRDVAWTFAYNPAGQLVTNIRDNDAYAWPSHADVERLYAVNGLNQYTAVAATAHTYDANGNLITDGINTYIYDAENRMVSASNGTTLTYDPMGRLWQVVKGAANTRFLYGGDALASEYDGFGVLLRRFVHGPDMDEPLVWYEGAVVSTANRRQLYANHQGSIVAIADASGMSIGVNSYDEYGIPAATNTGRFQYTGQILLSELGSATCPGIYHYKARLYSACFGRFLQTDPIGYEDQVNLYAYVANDPVNGTDPSGLECVSQKDGGSICDPPGDQIGSFPVPPANNPGAIGPNQAGHHVYNAETSTPYSSDGLTESVTQAVTDNPTPGNDSPATAAGVVNDAGISPFSGAMGDKVTSFLTTDSNGNTVVVNTTIPGQNLLNPGYVAQAIIPGSNSTSIVVVGEGNARIQQGPGAAMGGAVFQRKIESDMRRGIYNAVRNGRW